MEHIVAMVSNTSKCNQNTTTRKTIVNEERELETMAISRLGQTWNRLDTKNLA
jgi:hypothetical protein